VQLVTVRWGYCPAEARLMLLRCSAVLCHHVSDSSLSLTLPTGHRWSVTYCCYWIVPLHHTALDALVISDKVRIEVTGAGVPTYIVGTRLDYCNAILAGTADTVIKRLQSVQKTAARLVSGTIFRDHYHFFRQPHWSVYKCAGSARDIKARDRDETETLASPAETRR